MSRRLERGNDAPNALIHAVDLCGVHLHTARFPLLVRLFLPGGNIRITLAQFPVLVNDPHLDHALDALLAQPVPPRIEPPLVLRNILFMRMQRPMGRRVRHVLEERFGRIMLPDLPHSLVGNRVGEEVVIPLWLDRLIVPGQRTWLPVVGGAGNDPIEVVEPALARPALFRTIW